MASLTGHFPYTTIIDENVNIRQAVSCKPHTIFLAELMHKFHFVYVTENLANGKLYVGKHSTHNMDDGYLGSGKLIKQAIEKYGRENFIRSIIKFFDTSAEAFSFEAKLVDWSLVEDEQYYNVTTGGLGGGGNAKNFLAGLTPHENAVKAANTLRARPEVLRSRNTKIGAAQQQFLRSNPDTATAKALHMRSHITAESVQIQVKRRRENHLARMAVLMDSIDISEPTASIMAATGLSCSTICRAKKRKALGLTWENEIPSSAPHALIGTTNVTTEWRREASKKIALALTGKFTGDKSPRSKLTDAQRTQIADMVRSGSTRRQIQDMFCDVVTNVTINREILRAIDKYNISNFS